MNFGKIVKVSACLLLVVFLLFAQAGLSPFKLPLITSLPSVCEVGQLLFKSDATPGQNLYGCTSSNTWTQQGGSGGAGYPGAGIPVSTGIAWGTSLTKVTSVGTPGTDSNIPTEKAVRDAIAAGGGGGGVSAKKVWLSFGGYGTGAGAIAMENLPSLSLYTDGSGGRKVGVASFRNQGDIGVIKWQIPDTWDGGPITLTMLYGFGDGSGGNVDLTPGGVCFGNTVTDLTSLTYADGTLVSTPATASLWAAKTITLTMRTSGCSPGNWVHWTITRSNSDSHNGDDAVEMGFLSGTW